MQAKAEICIEMTRFVRDHFRRPWGPLEREICLLDGYMRGVPDKRWPEFSSNQVELLVQAGIPRAAAKKYYQLP